MKRSVIIGAVCALLTVGVAWATQVWRDNTDGGNHSLGNVSTVQINNGIGSGTRCAQFDSAGNLQPNATACGAGLGGSSGVSSVTGTAQHISATPTTGAVVVDTIGGYSTGAVTGGNVSMGAFASGVDEQTTTAGVAAPFTYQSVAGAAQFGAASGGGLAQDAANYFWDTANTGLRIGGGTLAGTSNRLMLTYANTSATVSAANALAIFNNTSASGQTIIAFQINGSVVGAIRPDFGGNLNWYASGGQGHQFYTSIGGTHGASIGGTGVYAGTGAGTVASHGAFETDGTLSTTGLYMGFAGTEFIKKHGGQLTVETDDAHAVVIATNGTAALTATTSQQLNVPATAAPSTPAATTATLYVDSTSKNIALKNDAGTVNHGIQTKTCGGSQWVNAISDAGGAACVQPAASDITGWPTAADVLISAGTSSAPVGDPNFTYNTSTHALTSAGQNFLGTSTGVAFLNSGAVQTTTIGSGLNLTGFTLKADPSTLPYDLTVTYGGANFIVDLPPLAFVGANPDFWLRPNAGFSTSTGGPSNFATQGQVWDVDTGGTYGTVSLRAFVYQCAITTSSGTNDFTFTVTKNGFNTTTAVVASCPVGGTLNTDYAASGSASFGPTDRVGIRGTVTNTGAYSSGALRATVHVRLSP